MKIPKKFTFMGIPWEVKQVNSHEVHDKLGATDLNAGLLYINITSSDKLKQQTFIHELLHIIYWQMGLDGALALGEEKEEVLVNTMANGLFAALEAKIVTF